MMTHSAEIDREYTTSVPLEAQLLITGYNQTNPQMNQANDVMRGIIMGAKIARDQAVSHRNFNIGAIGTGVRQIMKNGEHQYPIFIGANEKPYANGIVNIHAEREIIDAAKRNRSRLSSLALYGNNQSDQDSGVLFSAIVPCSAICLPMLKASEVVDESQTWFASLSPDRKRALIYKLPELEKAYSTRNPNLLHCITFDKGIELFDPENNIRELSLVDETDDSAFDRLFERIHQG